MRPKFEAMSISDYQFTYDVEEDSNGMPVITLEVTLDSGSVALAPDGSASDAPADTSAEPASQDGAGVHFLTEKPLPGELADPEASDDTKDKEAGNESSNTRNDLLEYMLRTDGTVVCKLCGEVLQSRTHWYRHKYKKHVIQPLNPAPLFQCDQCLVFFKSRKGYIGHLASRHSESLVEASNISRLETEEQASLPREPPELKRDPDPEPAVPKPAPALQAATKPLTKSTETKKSNKGVKDHRSKEDWEEKRYQEEKLVADIIDRVKRECEAQGSGGGERRGYTRRTTVMHT